MSKQNADKWFSRYIRLRDSTDGYCKCISCEKYVEIKEADCGHYINRKHLSLRYSEINCNAQCRQCNRFDEGNSAGYTIGLRKKHDDNIINKLLLCKSQTVKLTKTDYAIIAKKYRELTIKLEKEKGYKY